MVETKTDCSKSKKMTSEGYKPQTLKDFYESLPKQTSPKSDFVREVAERCDLSEQTVRFWLYDKFRPSRKEFLRVLSEMTGIPEENLFA